MRTALFLLSIAPLGTSALAQEASTPTVAGSSAPAAALPAGRQEAAPAPAAKPLSADERLAAEWAFFKDASADPKSDLAAAASDSLSLFVEQHPGATMADEALWQLASIYRAQGDYKWAMMTLLRLVYEHPDSKFAMRAKSDLVDLGNKKLSSKLVPALSGLVKGSDASEAADRLALLIQRTVEGLGDAFYEPAVHEIRRFQLRFPDFSRMDQVYWSLGQLDEKDGKYAPALSAYLHLIAAHPESPYCAQAQFAAGRLYADELKEYKKAIGAFQQLASQYPDSSLVLSALERTAQLFAGRLGQYELAVETDEKLIAKFPKTDGALKAYNHEATLLLDRLAKPEEAIKTYQRLAEEFGAPAGVEALKNASGVARRKLNDHKLEIEILQSIVTKFPNDKDAPEILYEIGQVYERDLDDPTDAIKTYESAATQYPASSWGKKAADRAAKLESKR